LPDRETGSAGVAASCGFGATEYLAAELRCTIATTTTTPTPELGYVAVIRRQMSQQGTHIGERGDHIGNDDRPLASFTMKVARTPLLIQTRKGHQRCIRGRVSSPIRVMAGDHGQG
jgi:hypothetical protein